MVSETTKRRGKALHPFRHRRFAAADAGAGSVDGIAAVGADGQAAAGEVPTVRGEEHRQIVAAHHPEPVGVGEAVGGGGQVDGDGVLPGDVAGFCVTSGGDPVRDAKVVVGDFGYFEVFGRDEEPRRRGGGGGVAADVEGGVDGAAGVDSDAEGIWNYCVPALGLAAGFRGDGGFGEGLSCGGGGGGGGGGG